MRHETILVSSIFWHVIGDRPFRVFYVPVSARTGLILRLSGMVILGMLVVDQWITQAIPLDIARIVLLLGFALINTLSVYYRWRTPLRLTPSATP